MVPTPLRSGSGSTKSPLPEPPCTLGAAFRSLESNSGNRGTMDLFSQDITRTVFRASIPRDMGQVSLSSVMLEVLRELDGAKDTLSVSRSLKMRMNTLRDILRHLYELRLIELVEAKREIVDRGFLKTLEAQLADITGPMAGVLIRDEIRKMGEEPGLFPKNRTEALVDRLAAKIFVEGKRNAFLKSMKGM